MKPFPRSWLGWLAGLVGVIVVGWAVWKVPALFADPVPAVLPVAEGEQEVALLLPATDQAIWERYVQAVELLAARKPPATPLAPPDLSQAFPAASSDVPQVALRPGHSAGWLRLRWYKLTSATDANYWVAQLARREPPPLAIIGGDNSNRATEQARALQTHAAGLAQPPWFLISYATADLARPNHGPRADLLDLYRDAQGQRRGLRFCFSNRQMARAVTDFLFRRPAGERPDPAPAYLVGWRDNSFSLDLVDAFQKALAAAEPARAEPPAQVLTLPHSIGGFGRPSRPEAELAEQLVTQWLAPTAPARPLLVAPANSWPARRFLRAVAHAHPGLAARLVVANGDGIDFNAIYRDGRLAWPIQDLPFTLVLFSQRNPVEPLAGFRKPAGPVKDLTATTAADTGTMDVLLYHDILEAVAEAAFPEGRGPVDAAAFTANLRRHQRFTEQGDRAEGTGEHVIYLQPERRPDGRVLPKARLRVFRRVAGGGWDPTPLDVQLTYLPEGGTP